MNDILDYMKLDPIFRANNHNKLTFSFFYSFSENYILPISHDEVVHGKASLWTKMSGTYITDKFSTLRTFMAYMTAHPGKKLSFMGNEFAQKNEWYYKRGLDWELLELPEHKQTQDFNRDLNKFYLDNSPLWQHDDSWDGFSWICHDDYMQSVIAFRRIDDSGNEIVVVCNFVPVKRENYRIGVPYAGQWQQVFSTDDVKYGGTGLADNKKRKTEDYSMHGYEQSITIDIPALSAVFFKYIPPKKRKAKTENVIADADKKVSKNKTVSKKLKEEKADVTPKARSGPKAEKAAPKTPEKTAGKANTAKKTVKTTNKNTK